MGAITEQDDILLTRDQTAMLFGSDVTSAGGRQRRSVRTGADYRWELPIRYRISETFSTCDALMLGTFFEKTIQ